MKKIQTISYIIIIFLLTILFVSCKQELSNRQLAYVSADATKAVLIDPYLKNTNHRYDTQVNAGVRAVYGGSSIIDPSINEPTLYFYQGTTYKNGEFSIASDIVDDYYGVGYLYYNLSIRLYSASSQTNTFNAIFQVIFEDETREVYNEYLAFPDTFNASITQRYKGVLEIDNIENKKVVSIAAFFVATTEKGFYCYINSFYYEKDLPFEYSVNASGLDPISSDPLGEVIVFENGTPISNSGSINGSGDIIINAIVLDEENIVFLGFYDLINSTYLEEADGVSPVYDKQYAFHYTKDASLNIEARFIKKTLASAFSYVYNANTYYNSLNIITELSSIDITFNVDASLNGSKNLLYLNSTLLEESNTNISCVLSLSTNYFHEIKIVSTKDQYYINETIVYISIVSSENENILLDGLINPNSRDIITASNDNISPYTLYEESIDTTGLPLVNGVIPDIYSSTNKSTGNQKREAEVSFTANGSGGLASIDIIDGGEGYTHPYVYIRRISGSGTLPVATATQLNGVINSITVTNAGANVSSTTIEIRILDVKPGTSAESNTTSCVDFIVNNSVNGTFSVYLYFSLPSSYLNNTSIYFYSRPRLYIDDKLITNDPSAYIQAVTTPYILEGNTNTTNLIKGAKYLESTRWLHLEYFLTKGVHNIRVEYFTVCYLGTGTTNQYLFDNISDAIYLSNAEFIPVSEQNIDINFSVLDIVDYSVRLNGVNYNSQTIYNNDILSILFTILDNNYKFTGVYDYVSESYILGNGEDPLNIDDLNKYFSGLIISSDMDLFFILKLEAHAPDVVLMIVSELDLNDTYLVNVFNSYDKTYNTSNLKYDNNKKLYYYEYDIEDNSMGAYLSLGYNLVVYEKDTNLSINALGYVIFTSLIKKCNTVITIISKEEGYYNCYIEFEIRPIISLKPMINESVWYDETNPNMDEYNYINIVNDSVNPFAYDEVLSATENTAVYSSTNKRVDATDTYTYQYIIVYLNVVQDTGFFSFSYRVNSESRASMGALIFMNGAAYYELDSYENKKATSTSVLNSPSGTNPQERFYNQLHVYGETDYEYAFSTVGTKYTYNYFGANNSFDDIVIPVSKGKYIYIFGYYRNNYGAIGTYNYNEDKVSFKNFNLVTTQCSLSTEYNDNEVEYKAYVNNESVSIDSTWWIGTRINLNYTPKDGYIILGYEIYVYASLEDFSMLVNPIKIEYHLGRSITFLLNGYSHIIPITTSSSSEAIIIRENYPNVYQSLSNAIDDVASGETIVLLKDVTLNTNATIPSNVILLLPTDESNLEAYDITKEYSKNGTSFSNKKKYLTLTIPEEVSLDIYGIVLNNAVTAINYTVNVSQGISGGYSEIVVNGIINVKNGGILESPGLITGNGLINVEAGGRLGETYEVDHWQGGTLASKVVFKDVYPINEFRMSSIFAKIRINQNAYYYGIIKMFALNNMNYTRFYQFGVENAMFKLSAGAYVEIVKNVVITDYAKDASGEHIYSTIRVNGGLSEMGATLNVAGLSQASSSYMYPIDGDMTIIFENGNYEINHRIKLLPGAKLIVEDDATLTINEGAELVVYKEDLPGVSDGLLCTYYLNGKEAKLINNGTIIVNGTLSGEVRFDKIGASLVLNSNAKISSTTYETLNMNGDVKTYNHYLAIVVYNNNGYKDIFYLDSDANIIDTSSTDEYVNKNLYLTNSYKGHTIVKYDSELIEYSISYILYDTNLNSSYLTDSDFIKVYTVEDDILLNIPVKPGFIFLGYYLSSDYLESELVDVITPGMYGNLVLYAKWVIDDELEFNFYTNTGTNSAGGITISYDGNSHNILLNDDSGLNEAYLTKTYDWYYYDETSGEWVKLNIFTNKISLVNVSSSGLYKVEVSLIYIDAYYNVTNTYIEYCNILINPIVINTNSLALSDVWYYYDGESHSPNININNLPEGATFIDLYIDEILSNIESVASSNVCYKLIKIYYGTINTNYVYSNSSSLYVVEISFEIKPKEIYVLWSVGGSEYTNSPVLEYDYNNEVLNILARTSKDGINNISLTIDISNEYDETTLLNSGVYQVKASFISNDANYLLLNDEIEIIINKITLNPIFVGSTNVDYDELAHYLDIKLSSDISLPNEITLSYKYNDSEWTSYLSTSRTALFTNTGSYEISVRFNSRNYDISEISTTLVINKVALVITWPSSVNIYAGQALNVNTLVSSSSALGSFIFDRPNYIHTSSGEKEEVIYFVPNNTNYLTLTKSDYLVIVNMLHLTLNDDGGVRIIDVLYNETLETPSITPRSGYNASWDDVTKLVNITTNVELTAVYSIITYTITYHLDNGVNDEGNPNTYNVDTNTLLLKEPSKLGYRFLGWYSDSEFLIPILNIIKGSTGNLNLYALFEIIEYSITYQTYGGVNNVNNPLTYTINDEITLYEASRVGYTFNYWSNSLDEKVDKITLGSVGNIVLYATYTIINYSITYVLSEGESNDVSNITEYNITTPTTYFLDAYKLGYTFIGWYLEDSYTNIVYYIELGTYGNIILYPKFDLIHYSITYELDELVSNTNVNTYTILDSEITLVNPSLTGYTFNYWYYLDNEEEIVINRINSGSTGNIVLYASFSPNEYNIYFNAGDGIVDIAYLLVYYEQAITTLPEANLTNSYFLGWYDSEDKLYQVGTIYLNLEDVVLYAKYSSWPILTYNTNGGSLIDPETHAFNTPIAAPNNPTLVGYNFVGWFVDVELTIPFIFLGMPNVNTTIYAKWEAKTTNVILSSESQLIMISATYDQYLITQDSLPTKLGYTFIGYYLIINETKVYYINNEGVGIKLWDIETSSVIMYAEFSINQYTITFESNGGSSIASITQDYHTTVYQPSNPIKDGYTFVAWYTDIELTNLYIFDYMGYSNITLYAKWENNIYYIYYNVGYDTTTVFTQSVSYLGSVTLLNASSFNKVGYTASSYFEGYALNEVISSYTLLSDLYLTVVYTINSYNLYLYYDNNEVYKVISYDYNSEVDLSDYKDKYGYTFLYYTLNNNKLESLYMPASDVNLYAVYSLNTPVITISGIDREYTYLDNIVLNASINYSFDASYIWYKGENVVLYGETLTLINVSDSGYYTLKVIMNDGVNYTTNTKSFNIVINKATIDISNLVFESASYIYDGQPHSLLVSGNNSPYLTITYNMTNLINVGSYLIKPTFSYDTANFNTLIELVPKYLSITQREIAINVIGKTKFDYDKLSHGLSFNLTNIVNGDYINITYTNVSNINAGVYQSTITGITGSSSSNYKLPSNVNFTYEICKIDISGIYFINEDFIYDGTSHNIYLNKTISQLGESLNIEYIILSSSNINAGTVYVRAIISNPNYNTLILDSSFIISKASATVTLVDQVGVYGSYVVNQSLFTISGLYLNDTLSILIEKEDGEDVGTYNLVGSLKQISNNYEVTFINAKYYISTRALTIQLGNQSYVYNKEYPTINQSMYQIIEGSIVYNDNLGISINSANLDVIVGSYDLYASYTNLNYEITFINASLTITARQVSIDFTHDNNTITKVYDACNVLFNYRIVNIIEGDVIEVIFNNYDFVNVNTYSVYPISINNSNYELNITLSEVLTIIVNKLELYLVIEDKVDTFDVIDEIYTYYFTDSANNLITPYDEIEIILARQNSSSRVINYAYPIYLVNTEILNHPNYLIHYDELNDYGIYRFIAREVSVSLENQAFTYNFNTQSINIINSLGLDESYFRYEVYNNLNVAASLLNVGVYKIVIYVDNHDEYNLIGINEFYVEITKLDVSELIRINDSEYTYNEKTQEISVYLLGHSEKVYNFDITELNNRYLIDAGVYHINVSIVDVNLSGSNSFEITINKALNTKTPSIILSGIVSSYHYISAYSINNVEYALVYSQDMNLLFSDTYIFDNLYDSHTYYLFIRYKESANYYASSYAMYEVSTLNVASYLELVNDITNKEVIIDAYSELVILSDFVLNHENENLSNDASYIINSYYELVNQYNEYVNNVNNQYESISYHFSAIAYLVISSLGLLGHAIILVKKFILGGIII